MHTQDFDINLENLAKIEGHTDLEIKVRGGKAVDIKLKITENKRFYTQGVRGKDARSVPNLVSRICGTCSIAHLTCCTEAVEHGFGIHPTEQTRILRRLTYNGLIIRDHAMHLYLFVMPDLFNKDSILEFDENNELEHALVHDAFDVKKAGNELCTAIAGRAVHATFMQVGSFIKIPLPEELKKAREGLAAVRPKVLDLIDVFYKCDFEFNRNTRFVALAADPFSFLDGEILSSTGTCIPEELFFEHLERVVIPYSQATGYEFEGKDYMVGALSRLNLSKQSLHKYTKKDSSKYLKEFPSNNVYANNLAQAIEILHCIDESIELIDTWEFKAEPRVEIKPREGTGIGVIEAPRGTLYYRLDLNKEGLVKFANLVIPSSQNQINMENDVKILVNEGLEDGQGKEWIQHEIEKLVRAYDPCMSCASHFLKFKWKKS